MAGWKARIDQHQVQISAHGEVKGELLCPKGRVRAHESFDPHPPGWPDRDGLLAGKSGVVLIDRFDTSGFPTKFAGQIKDFSSDGAFPSPQREDEGAHPDF